MKNVGKNIDNELFSNITDSDKIGFLLWQVNNYWQREFKKSFGEGGLTHGQLLLLLGILWEETNVSEVTQKKLSDRSGIDPMTTSTVLRTLQKKKLIKRKFSKKDSRTRLISLSEEGRATIEKSARILKNLNSSFFASLKDHQKQFLNDLITLLMSDKLNKKRYSHKSDED
jgi:Transcriptional regulators